jgi:hypothetical protein
VSRKRRYWITHRFLKEDGIDLPHFSNFLVKFMLLCKS